MLIPIEIVRLENNSYHVLVKVEMDGVRGDMIIDTGASVSVVDQKAFPVKAENRSVGKIQSGSITGQINDIHLLKIDYFKIGGRLMKNIRFAAIDLDYVNNMYDKHLNRKIVGLLGCDFCVRNGAVIDYNDKVMSINLRRGANVQNRKSQLNSKI